MKIDRLLAITIYLMNHGKTSANALADKFEVSSRTIMRDMDTLGEAGIPIQSTVGVDGGYEIIDTYVLEKQLANQKDYQFIVTALKGLSSVYANESVKKTLEKMDALTDKEKDSIYVDFGVAKEREEINKKVTLLEQAVKEERVVSFWYTNTKDETKQMLVEPAGIVYKWYNWYLIAYYEKYEDYCMFKLVRMEDVCLTDKCNLKKHSIDEIDFEDRKDQKVITVKLFGNAKVKMKCKEYLNGTVTKEYENGDFEYCFTVPEEETFWYGVLLSLEDKVRVLEPQSLVERMQNTARNLLGIYGEK